MEPPPVLIRTFKVKVRDPVRPRVRPVAQDKGMRGARVEPDVKNIKNLLKGLRFMQSFKHPFLETFHIPDISPLGLEGLHDPPVHLGIAQQKV